MKPFLQPYSYIKITERTFVIQLHDENIITIENTEREHVEKTVGHLNGAFLEGALFALSNKDMIEKELLLNQENENNLGNKNSEQSND